MKLFHLLGAASLVLLPACTSTQTSTTDHWNVDSIGPRVGRAFLGYDREKDGDSYLDFQWRRKVDASLTVRRHFFNQNPENPFQPEVKNYPRPRPENSLLPEPWTYFDFTLLDGPIATFSPGGFDEFWAGVGTTFEPISVVASSLLYNGLGVPNAKEQHGEPK
jgi:hypothetical protein